MPSATLPSPPGIPNIDKGLHSVLYGILLSLVVSAQIWKRGNLIRSFGLVLIYGIVDELLQIPVGRDADVVDFIFDMIGAGVVMGLFLVKKERKE